MANTTPITQATYQGAIAAVRAALAGGDFATARILHADAMLVHSALPQESTTGGNHTVKNRVEELDRIWDAIERAERAASGAASTMVAKIRFGGRW